MRTYLGSRACSGLTCTGLALALSLVHTGCESGPSDGGGGRESLGASSTRPSSPPRAGQASAELALFHDVHAANALSRGQLAGTVVALQGGPLEGGSIAWMTLAEARGWVATNVLRGSGPVRAGEAARVVAGMVGVDGVASVVARVASDESTALDALRASGVVTREVTAAEPISGARWLAWVGEARDRRDAGVRLVTVPAGERSVARDAEAVPSRQPIAAKPNAPRAGDDESFEDFGSSPAAAAASGASEEKPKPAPAPAKVATGEGAAIPKPRPEPLAVRLDQVVDGSRDGESESGRDTGAAKKRPAWVPGKPVPAPTKPGAKPASPAAPAKPNGGGR